MKTGRIEASALLRLGLLLVPVILTGCQQKQEDAAVVETPAPAAAAPAPARPQPETPAPVAAAEAETPQASPTPAPSPVETPAPPSATVETTAPLSADVSSSNSMALLPALQQPLSTFRSSVSAERSDRSGRTGAVRATELRAALQGMSDSLVGSGLLNPTGQEIVRTYQEEKFSSPLGDLAKASSVEDIDAALAEIDELLRLLEHYLPEYSAPAGDPAD